jgi:hypothetical protein
MPGLNFLVLWVLFCLRHEGLLDKACDGRTDKGYNYA